MKEHLLRSRKLEGLGQLAAGVVHDFNNTFGIISDGAELVMSKKSTGTKILRIPAKISYPPITNQQNAILRSSLA